MVTQSDRFSEKSEHPRPAASRPAPRAFTLVELLVVIGIIALIISILLPSLAIARARANTLFCSSNLRMIGMAIRAYAGDNKDSLPPGYKQLISGTVVEDAIWLNFIHPYLVKVLATRQTTLVSNISKTYFCPDAFPSTAEFHYSGHPVAMPDMGPGGTPWKPYKLSRFRQEYGRIILATDGVQIPQFQYYVDAILYQLDFPVGPNDVPINPGPNTDSDTNIGNIRWRHYDQKPGSKKGVANFVFPDDHVETLGQKQVTRSMVWIVPVMQ